MRRPHEMGVLSWLAGVIIVLFVALVGIRAEEGTAPPEPTKETEQSPETLQARIAALIEQLGAADYEQRRAAQDELAEIGEPARAQLAKALEHKDAEVVFRAQEVLKELELARITFEVVDRNGKPVTDRKICVILNRQFQRTTPDQVPPEPIKVEGTLQKDGRLFLGALEPGMYYVRVETDGYCKENTIMSFGKGRYVRRFIAHLGGHIKGRVVDVKNDNKPLQGVRVSIFDLAVGMAPRPDGEGGPTEVTDDKGEFSFKNLSPGSIQIELDYKYRLVKKDRREYVNVVDEETTETTMEVMEEKWFYGQLKFQILDPDGNPFKGEVQVYLTRAKNDAQSNDMSMFESRMSRSGRFLDDGAFQMERLDIGKYNVVLYVKGCACCRLKEIEIKGNETVELKEPVNLQKGLHLKVKAFNDEGKPMENAFVLLADADGPPREINKWEFMAGRNIPKTWDTTQSDKDGAVEFDSLAEGRYAVRVYDANSGLSDETIVEVKRDGETPSLEISYGKHTAIALKVVDKETGNEVPGLQPMYSDFFERVVNRGNEKPDEKAGRIRMRSYGMPELGRDSAGRFVLCEADKGRGLIFMAEGYKTAIYKVEDIPGGKITEVTLKMEKFGKGGLKAKVAAGKGVKLEEIKEIYVNSASKWQGIKGVPQPDKPLKSGKAVELHDGAFEAADIAEGPCYVSMFNKEDRLLALFRADIENGKVVEAVFEMPATGEVAGILKDPDGNPMPGAQLTLLPDSMMACLLRLGRVMSSGQGAQIFPSAITDEEGRFSFGSVPEGDYALYQHESASSLDFRYVTVKPGETSKVDFTQQKPVDITITLKLPEGEQMPEDALVTLMEIGHNPAGTLMLAFPGAQLSKFNDGRITLTGVYPGKHRLLVLSRKLHGIIQDIDVTPETKNIEISATFTPGKCAACGKISSVSYDVPVPFGMALLWVLGDKHVAGGFAMPDGSFELKNLHPDRYRVFTFSLDDLCVNNPAKGKAREFTVEEGKDLEGIVLP